MSFEFLREALLDDRREFLREKSLSRSDTREGVPMGSGLLGRERFFLELSWESSRGEVSGSYGSFFSVFSDHFCM